MTTPSADQDKKPPDPERSEPKEGFVGGSPSAKSIQKRIRNYAKLDSPILLVGETGTGKELVAQQLHRSAPRKAYPFTAVNCAAMSPTLLQSELFGHVRGAFTGASRARAGLFDTAANGTLLLDEIGDMSTDLQAALLRVLETREYRPLGSDTPHPVRCRIITATNRDLQERIEEGAFRQDLFFRISGLTLRLPPLRERLEDIAPLSRHFLRMFHPRPGKCEIASDLQEAFLAHSWPGNVRELRGIIENLCLLFSDLEMYHYSNLAAIIPDWGDRALSTAPQTGTPVRPRSSNKGAIPHGATSGARREASSHPVQTGNRERETPLPGGEGGYVVPPRPQYPMSNLQKLEACFEQHRTLRRKDILIMLGISHTTASLLLRELMNRGTIRKIMPNKSPISHYFVYNEA